MIVTPDGSRQTDGKWLFLEQLECVLAVPVVNPVSAGLAVARTIEHKQQIMTTCLYIPVVQTVVQWEMTSLETPVPNHPYASLFSLFFSPVVPDAMPYLDVMCQISNYKQSVWRDTNM